MEHFVQNLCFSLTNRLSSSDLNCWVFLSQTHISKNAHLVGLPFLVNHNFNAIGQLPRIIIDQVVQRSNGDYLFSSCSFSNMAYWSHAKFNIQVTIDWDRCYWSREWHEYLLWPRPWESSSWSHFHKLFAGYQVLLKLGLFDIVLKIRSDNESLFDFSFFRLLKVLYRKI